MVMTRATVEVALFGLLFSERRGSLTQNCRKRPLFFHGSRCVARPWDFVSGSGCVFVQVWFLGEGLSSQIEELRKKKGYTSFVARV